MYEIPRIVLKKWLSDHKAAPEDKTLKQSYV